MDEQTLDLLNKINFGRLFGATKRYNIKDIADELCLTFPCLNDKLDIKTLRDYLYERYSKYAYFSQEINYFIIWPEEGVYVDGF